MLFNICISALNKNYLLLTLIFSRHGSFFIKRCNPKNMNKRYLLSLMVFITCLLPGSASAIILPPGFSQVLVAPGITMPTTMTVTPDGRFLVCEQSGALRVVKHDTLLTRPFVTLSVNTNGERGLLGVAVDPDFVNNQYIYLCYTIANGSFNRVSRFTASGDTVIPGSEHVVLDLDTLIANYHGGGHLGFGPDGKLYVAAGENGRSILAQNLDSYLGKILRINSDGTAPLDNPFPGPAKRNRVWAYGMRNPFTFSFQPGTGRLFLNDVGEVTYEEINDATTGGLNFGWPQAEGPGSDTSLEYPFFYYRHGVGIDSGCAITGGTFFNPDSGVSNYPPSYINKYYYIDYCGNWINCISLGNPPVWSNFASDISFYSVGITMGPDGNLYYLSRNNEALYKITFSTNNVPFILNEPIDQTASLGFPATFTVNAGGALPLTYQWRKGTTPIGGATSASFTIPTSAFTDSGYYNVIVTNSFGSTTSINAHLSVTANQPPNAVIDLPTDSMYSAGELISYHGSASDPESGALPDSLFEWVIVFHHDTHVHPGPTGATGTSSGSFVVPNVGEHSTNVFYRIILIVHDPDGAVDSTYYDIHPRVSGLTITTQPSGLSITLDGQPFNTPYTIPSVEGMVRTIGTSAMQLYNSTPVYFTSWNNGGTLLQNIVTPVNDTLIAAYFDSLQLQYSLGNDTIVCTVTDTLVIDAGANYLSYAWSDGSIGRFMNLQSSTADTILISVTVKDSNGMTGNDTINVIFDNCDFVETVPGISVKVYPVPAANEVTIDEINQNYFLNVIDINGRIIIDHEFVSANHLKNIRLQPGLYSFLLISKEGKILAQKKITIVNSIH
jgi:glucose/arabinose dehydrogenase